MKLRAPDSVEAGVLRALDVLGPDAAREVTGKSLRLIRAWSDPDDDARRIPAHQMINLDAACMCAGHGAPILEGYRAALARRVERMGGAPQHQAEDPHVRFTSVVGELGDVGDALRRAVQPDSPGGKRLTSSEIMRARQQIREAREALDALDRDLAALQGGQT